MPGLKSSRARELIRQLNRINLSAAEYSYVKSLIENFNQDFYTKALILTKGQRLYRGVLYDSKPTEVSCLGAPPARLVKGFQRCNQPNAPMFYCSVDSAAVFYELGVKEGDTVYLSKWTVNVVDLLVNSIICPVDEKFLYPALEMVNTYFETVFAQPIHEIFSHQYKITTAITEFLIARDIKDNVDNWKMGGLLFPSVAHPSKSDNLVLYPDIAERCLTLDYVQEVKVVKVDRNKIDIEYTDISSDFNNGKINWSGRPKKWKIAPGNLLRMTAEGGDWIVRDINGNVIDPH